MKLSILDPAAYKMGTLFRNFLVLGAGNYLAMGVSLVVNAILTRQLGAERFGRLALLLTASQMLLLLTANWTQTAIVRFGAQEFASRGSVAETFWTRTWIVAPWAAVAVAAMLVEHDRVAAFLSIPPWGLAVVLTHFVASFALSMIGSAFQARNEMRRYGTMLFLDKAVLLTVLVLLPSTWGRGPLAVLSVYAVSSAAVAIGGLVCLRASLVPVVFSRSGYRTMWSFSLPLILSSWVGLFGTNWFDILVIKWYRPLSEVGFYSLGTLLAGVVGQITIIFSTLLLPQLSVMVARGELDQIRTLADRLLPYWFLGTSVLFSVVLLGAGSIVPLIFGRAFEPSVPVLALLMLAACALALFNAFSPLVSAFGSSWALTGICLASGAVNVVMDLVLVPRFGIAGAAFATVLAYGTSAMLVLSFVERRLRHRVFNLGLLSLPVVVVCACLLLFEGLRFYLLAIPAGAITAYWLVRRFRLFREEDTVFLERIRLLIPLARQA